MKHLKIEDENAYFSLDGTTLTEVENLGKEELLSLLDLALKPEYDFEMDEYNESLVKNPAQQIIYKNIYSKLKDLESEKTSFVEDIEGLYKDEYGKYKIQDEPDEVIA